MQLHGPASAKRSPLHADVGVMAAAPLVTVADGPDSPVTPPDEVCRLLGLPEPDLLLGWVVEDRPWLEALHPGRARTIMAGYGLAAAVQDGRVEYLPVRLASVPRLLRSSLRPDVAIVSGCRRGGGYAFRGSVGWAHAAAASARMVVVEVDEEARDLGGPPIPGDIALVLERKRSLRSLVARPASPVDAAIGATVATLVPPGATLQVGIGGLADAVLANLDAPVQIWSGLVSDGLALLDERGLLEGTALATYVWGTDRLGDLAAAGRLRIVPLEVTHDIGAIARLARFVAVNTALEVGLDGSINVERVDGRVVAGIGGHADFCAAASLCPGGLSVIALRSERGDRSAIRPTVEVVSTGRSDVDVVVTEHGIADLRGLGAKGRAEALIEVAAPHHREQLASAAMQ